MTGQQLEVGGGGLVLRGGGSANFMQVNFCKVTRTVFCCFKIFNKTFIEINFLTLYCNNCKQNVYKEKCENKPGRRWGMALKISNFIKPS